MKDKRIFLTVAGSDPSGGAGVEVDIKTADRMGVYPCAVITAITAQNTLEVGGVWEVETEHVRLQLESVLRDFKPDAVKIGMLCSEAAVKTVATVLADYDCGNIVVDPILSPTLSAIKPDANLVKALVTYLFPLAALVTPNLLEKETIETIMGEPIRNFCGACLVKGGHGDGKELVDILYLPEEGSAGFLPSTAFPTLNMGHSSLFNHDSILPLPAGETSGLSVREYHHRRIPTTNTHGSGCVLSSAIACNLAKGEPLDRAVKDGLQFVEDAISHSSKFRISTGTYGPCLI